MQSGSGTNSVTIVFKEFGIRLNFTPTVLGNDLINLKVKPEVSSLDFANAVILDGFRVPALSTRRTETEVELRDGQTFAIAGLMNNTVTSTMGKIPGIGDIPILGLLFKSKAHQKAQTELVVMITPTIIKRGQMGVSEGLPSIVEPYMRRPDQTYPNPDAYTGSPRYPADRPQPREGNGPAAPAAPARSDNAPAAPAAKPATASPAPAATAPVPSRPVTQTTAPASQPATATPSRTSTPAAAPQRRRPRRRGRPPHRRRRLNRRRQRRSPQRRRNRTADSRRPPRRRPPLLERIRAPSRRRSRRRASRSARPRKPRTGSAPKRRSSRPIGIASRR